MLKIDRHENILFFILFLLEIKTAGSVQNFKSRSGYLVETHNYLLLTSHYPLLSISPDTLSSCLFHYFSNHRSAMSMLRLQHGQHRTTICYVYRCVRLSSKYIDMDY